MSKKISKKPVAIAMGAALTGGLIAAGTANAAANPFALSEMSSGYMQVAEGKCGGNNKAAEAKCGGKAEEAKCGGKAEEAKCGGKAEEAKCGGNKAEEAKCGGAKPKTEEGKCGEGKCGGSK